MIAPAIAAHHERPTLDKIIRYDKPGNVTWYYYLVAKFLQQHGQKEQALELLKSCATSPDWQTVGHTLARRELRLANEPIGDLRATEVVTPNP